MFEDVLDTLISIKEEKIIKVMGVGGGGCNAVNYMYRQNIPNVSFLVCNTDKQVLEKSDVPDRLQIGPGLGAGGVPEVGQRYAEESRNAIKDALSDGTKMLFITAGMGGGTGTGASPIIASVAQELGILTVAITTIPFLFEGIPQIEKALRGVAALADKVDAILVINNEKLIQIYPDYTIINAFSKSNDVVCNVARSIAEIVTLPGVVNTDFADVSQTLTKGGVAIMGVGYSQGSELRIDEAIQNAISSPLINTSDIRGAKRILMQFYCSNQYGIKATEVDQIQKFVADIGLNVNVKWGLSIDDDLGKDVKVTIVATGYDVTELTGISAESDDVVLNKTLNKYYGPRVSTQKTEVSATKKEINEESLNMSKDRNTNRPITSTNIDEGGITIEDDVSDLKEKKPWIK